MQALMTFTKSMDYHFNKRYNLSLDGVNQGFIKVALLNAIAPLYIIVEFNQKSRFTKKTKHQQMQFMD